MGVSIKKKKNQPEQELAVMYSVYALINYLKNNHVAGSFLLNKKTSGSTVRTVFLSFLMKQTVE